MKLQLLTLVASALASAVEQLTTDGFTDFLSSKDMTLVEFYAPWCGHCKALAPEYEKAAVTVDEYEGAKIALAKIDCTEETEVCNQFEVRGYPTLIVFKGEEAVDKYDGPRTAEGISSFLIRRSQPVVKYLESSAEAKKLEGDVVALGFYGDKASNETFQAVAEEFRDRLTFAQLPAKVAKEYGVKAPGVVVVKSSGEQVVLDKFDGDNLRDFVNVESFPEFGEIGPQNYLEYTQSGIPLLFAFVEDDEQRESLKEWISPHLESLHGKANVVFLDTGKFGGHAANVNIREQWPALVVHDIDSNKKFPHPQEEGVALTKKSVAKFVEDFVAGAIEPSIKSDPVPETQDGPVYILVGKEYDDVVLDDDKDVLVEFYAPWCGHCKTLSPIYDQLGEAYSGVDSVVIAKLDHTTNEVPDHITGYPTIKLFPAGKKDKAVTFNGGRNLEELKKFIKENGTHKAKAVEVPKKEDEDVHEDL